MLKWALLFLVLAAAAGILGFVLVAGTAAYIAKILFFVFLILLIEAAIPREMRGGTP